MDRTEALNRLTSALVSKGYELMTSLRDTSSIRSMDQWVGRSGTCWVESTRDLGGNVLGFELFTPATRSSSVNDTIAAIDLKTDWSDPPRRGVDWDLFENEDGLALERIDTPDDREYPRFPGDDEAASFVLMTAGWEGCPRPDVRDECRWALVELSYCWEEEELPLGTMLEAVKVVLRRDGDRWFAGTDDITELVGSIEKRVGHEDV